MSFLHGFSVSDRKRAYKNRILIQFTIINYKVNVVNSFYKEKIMRIDKFLKVSRILKRRTLAQESCDKSKVCVNGKAVKPAYQIKIGDEVEINYTNGSLKFIIKEIKETVKKDEAQNLYEIITEN